MKSRTWAVVMACGMAAVKTPGETQPTNQVGQTVVVTATRLAMPAKEVASSITVITAEELERKQSATLSDALRELPGVDVVQSGGRSGLVSAYIRGAKSEQVLVLVDGVEVNDPSSAAREADLSQIPVENVERIEILRGPQSTLYGSDAIGGVINIITKRGEGPLRVNLSAEAGSFNTFNESAEARGGTKTFNYSVGLSRQDSDGISSASAENGNTERDGYEKMAVSSRLGWTPAEDFALDAYMRWNSSRYDYDDFDYLSGLPVDAESGGEAKHLLLRVEGDLKAFDQFWEQKLGVSLANHDRDDHTAYAKSSFDSSLKKVDWQHNLFLSEANILTAGFEHEEESAESVYEAATMTDRLDRKTARNMAGFVQDYFKMADASATVGGRVDDHSEFGSEWTWRIAPMYEIKATGTRLKGTYGTGFKAPSLFQLYSIYGSPDLQPEKSAGWDAGVEQDLLGERITLGLTWYENRFDDMIDYNYATFTYGNIAEAQTRGAEATLAARPADWLTVRAAYTRTHTEDRATGQELVRRPKNKAFLNVECAVTEKLKGSVGVLYVGERQDQDFTANQRIILDAYTLVNVYGSYEVRKGLTIFGRVENVFDKDYVEVLGYGTPGLAGYGGVKLSF